MNSTQLADGGNATSFDNQSRCYKPYSTETIVATYYAMLYSSVAVGIPGNILSAIVWLRRHVAGKTSSAVYLASLAIVDLVFLPVSLYMDVSGCFGDRSWWCTAAYYVFQSSATVEPLLVLSFSVERLIAILRPFRVCL